MAIDVYSYCPGGTGKKLKFCCGSEFIPELEKIDRMIEGEQYWACLNHINHLLEQQPDRACLLAMKCLLLRATDQDDAAGETAKFFLEKHPGNQIALAELAIYASATDAQAALDYLLQSLRSAGGQIAGRVYQTLGIVAEALLHESYALSTRALLQLQLLLSKDDTYAAELLSAFCHAAEIPLVLRDAPPPFKCPDDAPWKDRFNEAAAAVAVADWRLAEERLAAIAADAPLEAVVWRHLATVRGWLADNAGCIEALRKYAPLRAAQPDGLDDAVEAEAIALFLSDNSLGDAVETLKVVWTVKDVDRAQEGFLSSPRFLVVPFDPGRFSDGETPPPKAAYLLLDQPMPESAEGATLETMPRLVGRALLFGRQTDCEAHFDVLEVAGNDLSSVVDMVAQAAGDAVEPQPRQEVFGKTSASRRLFNAAWLPPRGMSPETLQALTDQHLRDAILEQWPNQKLGILDGLTPHEAAGDEKYRIRLMAALMVLEYWTESLTDQFDFNELRARLALPLQEPIDPAKHPVESIPMVRLARVDVEKLSDKDLLTAYYRAGAYGMRVEQHRFAEAVVRRPSLADSDERLNAYVILARTEINFAKAMEYIDMGRRAAESRNKSSASWDLMELSLAFGMRDTERVMRLIEHIDNRHFQEPGVAEALTRMLIDFGLLRPDGTPAYDVGMAAAAQRESAVADETGGLWTPESAAPSGGGKLWTPDS